MIGYIYLTTDTTNGMQYVGQHHYNKEGELDPNYHGSGVIIKNIYKKRPETLKEEYIKTCYSEEEMNNDEKYYIKLYKTLWPNGYNLTEGGDGCIASEETRRKMSNSLKGKPAHNKGVPMSEEQKKKLSVSIRKSMTPDVRKKISDSKKGKHRSEETRRKLSEKHKGLQSGEKHPFFGKHQTEEARKKISDSKKGKHLSEETRKKLSEAKTNGKTSKIVLQFTLDGEFVKEWPSTMECERNGFSSKKISLCCLGKQKTHKGFKWQYA